jgi:hypothetical protein
MRFGEKIAKLLTVAGKLLYDFPRFELPQWVGRMEQGWNKVGVGHV